MLYLNHRKHELMYCFNHKHPKDVWNILMLHETRHNTLTLITKGANLQKTKRYYCYFKYCKYLHAYEFD